MLQPVRKPLDQSRDREGAVPDERLFSRKTTMPLLALAVLFSLAATIPAVHAQDAGKRVALIIGNDAYAISPLKNAVNDAHAMDAALRASNFRTILVENAKKADMESKLAEFPTNATLRLRLSRAGSFVDSADISRFPL